MAVRIPQRFKAGITRHRPDDPQEAAELTAWWRKMFGPSRLDPRRDAWLYEQNPCIGADGPGPWLCRRDGEIVGQQGDVPFDLCVRGERVRAAWAIDLHVDEAWRLRGVGPALISTLLDNRPVACMVDMSDDGYAAFKGARCVDLGVVPAYRRPLDHRRALRMAGVPVRVRRFGLALAPILEVADGLFDAALRLSGVELVPVERLDERVDEVWTAASPAYAVLAGRDLAASRWRIDERPNSEDLQRYYFVRRGRTIGYAVVRFTVSSGETAVTVVDYLAPPHWVTPMLLAVGRRTHQEEGAVALSLRSRNEPADRWLRAAGFVRRTLAHESRRRVMVHTTLGHEVATTLSDPDLWFLTAADSTMVWPARSQPQSEDDS